MADLDKDLSSAEFMVGVEQEFWSIPERSGHLVYVTLFAPDGRSFMAQLDCSSYWEQPIRCLFVNPATKTVDLNFWPHGNQQFEQWIKFRPSPNPPFICWPQDRGAIEIGRHFDWQPEKQWQRQENQIVAYLNFLRKMLHVPANGYLRKSNTTPST